VPQLSASPLGGGSKIIMKSIKFIFIAFVLVLTSNGQSKQHKTDLTIDKSDSTVYITPETIINSNRSECEPWVKKVYPIYPDSALKYKIEGKVVLKTLIGKGGRVKRVILISSSNSIFNDVSIKAMKKWIFEPAMMNGKYVEVWVIVPFVFKLNK
jgi:TonB family protein